MRSSALPADRRAPRPEGFGDPRPAQRGPRITKQIFIDVVAAMSRHAVVAAAGLLLIPLIARRLGDEGLGAWALLGTSSFLLGLSDLGLTTVVHRAAAVKEDAERARRSVGLTLSVILIVSPILSLAAYPMLLDLPGASEALLRDMSRAVLIAFPAGILGALSMPFRGFALVRGGVTGLARARIWAVFAQVIVTAVGLAISPTLVAPSLGILASSVVELAMIAHLARSIDPALSIRPRMPESAREVTEGLSGGAPTLTLNLVLAAGTRADIFILSHVGSLAVVAAYGVASRAVDQSFTLAKQISTAMLPRLGDAGRRAEAVRLGTRMFGVLACSGMAAIALHGQAPVIAWAGTVSSGPVAGRALAMLGLAAAIASTYEIAASALTLGGRTAWESTIPLAIGSVINVAVSIAGVGRFGVWAVAGGTVLGNLGTAALVWIRAKKLLRWSWVDVGRGLVPALLAGAISAASGWGLGKILGGSASASLVICAVSTALGCGAALLLATRRGVEHRRS